MQPVSNIFSKMPRLVRDLTHSLGRRARLEMEGVRFRGKRIDMEAHLHKFRQWEFDGF